MKRFLILPKSASFANESARLSRLPLHTLLLKLTYFLAVLLQRACARITAPLDVGHGRAVHLQRAGELGGRRTPRHAMRVPCVVCGRPVTLQHDIHR